MIGLILIPAFVIWFIVSAMLSSKIPDWLGIKKHATALTLILFPFVLVAPVADEIIGRWQFNRLCEREAVVWLSPDWAAVKRAIQRPDIRREMDGHLIPMHGWSGDIIDVDTGNVIMSSQSLFTNGGFLRRYLYGLNGQAISCHPKDIQDIQAQVKITELLKQGK